MLQHWKCLQDLISSFIDIVILIVDFVKKSIKRLMSETKICNIVNVGIFIYRLRENLRDSCNEGRITKFNINKSVMQRV